MSAPLPIAVHRFRTLSPESGPEDDDVFARGFHDDLVTELARFGAIEVLAADSANGAAYELSGSIRRARGRARVSALLVERASGRHLWAERFDAADDDPFDVQSEIASAVAGTLAAHLDGVRLDRARRAPATSLATYECWLRGRALLEEGSVEADLAARELFQRAIELDPAYSRAWVGLSLSHYNDWTCQSWHLWEESERHAREYAERAVALDPSDPMVHIVLARVQLYRREFDRAAASIDRALALNANDADVLASAALWKAYLGDADQARRLARRAIELNPRHGPWYHVAEGLALFVLRRHEEAGASFARADRTFVDSPAYRAACAALGGAPDETARALGAFHEEYVNKIAFGRAPGPGEELRWLVDVNPFRRAQDAEHFVAALRAAGLEGGDAPPVGIRPAELVLEGNVFRREGEVWTLSYDGAGARIVEVKGLFDLARLLERPGEPVHCLELAGAPPDEAAAALFDPRARAEIRERMAALADEIDAADEAHDLGRAERAREELERLTAELSKALGLGGRSRRLGDVSERARSAATWRIRSAIKKIAAAHPRLGRHLESAVRTGTFCRYEPERPTSWSL